MLMRMWSNRNSHSSLVGMQTCSDTLEDSLAVSYKTKQILAIRSSSSATWYLPNGAENLSPPKTCAWIFIAPLFKVAETWKEPRSSLVGEWKNKLWYLQKIEYI